MIYYGIFVNGKLDTDPEPMTFYTWAEAAAVLRAGQDMGIYDDSAAVGTVRE